MFLAEPQMTKLLILRSSALENLRAGIQKNLARYRKGDFSYLVSDSAQHRELTVDFDDSLEKNLKNPSGAELYEVDNCIVVGKALKRLSPYEARDERLWAFLSHTYFLEHARKRWPIPENDEDAISHIKKHFFGRDKRQIERDNVASRLWWMAHLCDRVSGIKQEKALRAFLHKSDVRANIVERPTTAQSIALFSALVKKLSQSFDGEKKLFERATFRNLMTLINSVGGFKLLDVLDEPSADHLLDSLIRGQMQLKKI
jgi:hypothetical protein